MSATVATDYVRRMVHREASGWGDQEPAMRRLEARYGLGFWTLKHLFDRKAKTVDASIFARIRGAYLAHCEGQIANLQHELQLEKAASPDDFPADLLAEIEALAAKVRAARRARR